MCPAWKVGKEKRETTERIEEQNQEKIRMLREKENCKFLRILEADTIKQGKIKWKNKKRRTKKIVEIYFSSRNIIKAINT